MVLKAWKKKINKKKDGYICVQMGKCSECQKLLIHWCDCRRGCTEQLARERTERSSCRRDATATQADIKECT